MGAGEREARCRGVALAETLGALLECSRPAQHGSLSLDLGSPSQFLWRGGGGGRSQSCPHFPAHCLAKLGP